MPTPFPPSPSINDEFDGYRWDGIAWELIGIDLAVEYAPIKGARLIAPREFFNIDSSAAPASTTPLYLDTSSVTQFTTNMANDFILDVKFNSAGTPTLDSTLTVGESVSVTVIVKNGSSTPYKMSSVKIDGTTAGTILYANGTNATTITSSTYIYNVTIIKTASATFTALVSSSRFA